MTDIPKDVAGQFASGGQSSGSAYPNAAFTSGNFRGGQSLRDYHGSAHGGDRNAANGSANHSQSDRRADMADYDRYGRDTRSPNRNTEDRDNRGAGYAGRNWAQRTGDEVASWAGDRDAEYRRERDRDRLGRYPGEEAGEHRFASDRHTSHGNEHRDGNLNQGVGYGGRNWAERGGDEVASWAGDRDAEYRRERDRDRLGRYPGEESGERRYGQDADRYGYGTTGGNASRHGSNRDRDDDRTVQGSGYQGRNWAERAGDEVQSWVGDRDAEQRREQDRQRLGRYPGEDAGERMTGRGRSGYEDRYFNDRDGYRSGSSNSGQSGQGRSGQTAYGSYGSQGGQTAYGTSGNQDRSFGQSGGYGGADYQTSQTNFRTDRSGNEASRSHGSDDPTRTYSQSSTGGQSRGQYGQAMRSDEGDNGADDRGFLSRASDEVASWFGDEEAERRRQLDQSREDSRDAFDGAEGRQSKAADPGFAAATGFSAGTSRPQHDPFYANYRNQRAAELDQDFNSYDEERRKTFETDFSTWRSSRKQGAATQSSGMGGNALASQVRDHAKVEGSDGKPVGTVDRVTGGDIKLSKKDSPDGKHHLIPMSWVSSVDGDRVCLSKTADEAKAAWRNDEGGAAI